MRLGAIVEYEGHRWRIYKVDRNVRTVTLMRWGGTLEEVANDDPKAVVVADTSQWPIVTARLKPNAGPLVRLMLPRAGISRELTPLVDWVPSDLMRPGGSIFMSPALKLGIGETLVAVHKDGTATRVVITKNYGTMAQRQARGSEPPKKKGLMDFLDGEDFIK